MSPTATGIDYKAIGVPEPVPIGLVAGDDRNFVWDVVDEHGAAVDVSAATAIAFTVRDGYGGTSRISKSLSGGITVSTSRITVDVDAADSSSLAASSRYVYDLQVTLSGAVVTVARGPFVIVAGVS